MAHRVARRSFGRSAGSRRKTEWIGSADVTALTALAGSAAILDQSFPGTAVPTAPFTVMRTRGSLYVRSDQTANTEDPFGAIGFAVVSTPAAAIGVTAVPTPITDESSDLFFVWEPWACNSLVASEIGFDANSLREFKIDSKAMRKVSVDETIVITIVSRSRRPLSGS